MCSVYKRYVLVVVYVGDLTNVNGRQLGVAVVPIEVHKPAHDHVRVEGWLGGISPQLLDQGPHTV